MSKIFNDSMNVEFFFLYIFERETDRQRRGDSNKLTSSYDISTKEIVF